MIIFLTILVIAIIIFLCLYTHFSFMKDADGKTLRPMSEWLIFAKSSNYSNREKICYSLIIQSANLTEQLNIVSIDTIRQIMRSKPTLCKANFVLFIMQHATGMAHQEELIFLEEKFKVDHARAYLGYCIIIILNHYGLDYLERISADACAAPVEF